MFSDNLKPSATLTLLYLQIAKLITARDVLFFTTEDMYMLFSEINYTMPFVFLTVYHFTIFLYILHSYCSHYILV